MSVEWGNQLVWYQRESPLGSDHQNQAIHVRSEVKSPFWKSWSEQILRLSLFRQTSILSRTRSWIWKWDLLSFFLIFDCGSQYAVHGFFPSASRRWCLDRDYSKVWNNMDTGVASLFRIWIWISDKRLVSPVSSIPGDHLASDEQSWHRDGKSKGFDWKVSLFVAHCPHVLEERRTRRWGSKSFPTWRLQCG